MEVVVQDFSKRDDTVSIVMTTYPYKKTLKRKCDASVSTAKKEVLKLLLTFYANFASNKALFTKV